MKREHSFTTTRTAHYYTLGYPGPGTRYYWLACHGYGHLAGDFINDFNSVADDETLIVAPEALNKFYWNGFGGPPVAAWMTSHQRLDEIEDYVNYLHNLHKSMLSQLPAKTKIILFGFSQGVATVCRFIARCNPDFHELVLWAGQLPQELDASAFGRLMNHRPVHVALGNADPFATQESIAEQTDFMKKAGLNIQKLDFEGKHFIPATAIQELRSRIR
jgi:predicted esterase